MADENPGCLNPGEPVEGGQCHLRLVCEGSRLRALAAGEHVAGGECVAYEYGIHRRHMHGDAARRVTRHRDDDRTSGEIEHVTVCDLGDLLHIPGAHSVLA